MKQSSDMAVTTPAAAPISTTPALAAGASNDINNVRESQVATELTALKKALDSTELSKTQRAYLESDRVHNAVLQGRVGAVKEALENTAPDRLAKLEREQIEAIERGYAPEEVRYPSFGEEHLKALRQGISPMEIQGLSALQVTGMRAGLSRKEVLDREFSETHLKEHQVKMKTTKEGEDDKAAKERELKIKIDGNNDESEALKKQQEAAIKELKQQLMVRIGALELSDFSISTYGSDIDVARASTCIVEIFNATIKDFFDSEFLTSLTAPKEISGKIISYLNPVQQLRLEEIIEDLLQGRILITLKETQRKLFFDRIALLRTCISTNVEIQESLRVGFTRAPVVASAATPVSSITGPASAAPATAIAAMPTAAPETTTALANPSSLPSCSHLALTKTQREYLSSKRVEKAIQERKFTVWQAILDTDPILIVGFTPVQIRGIELGCSPQEIRYLWFSQAHVDALMAGIAFEEIQGLNAHQVAGIRLGLSREQMLSTPFFTDAHIEALKKKIEFDTIRGLTVFQAQGILAGFTRTQVLHPLFSQAHIDACRAGFRQNEVTGLSDIQIKMLQSGFPGVGRSQVERMNTELYRGIGAEYGILEVFTKSLQAGIPFEAIANLSKEYLELVQFLRTRGDKFEMEALKRLNSCQIQAIKVCGATVDAFNKGGFDHPHLEILKNVGVAFLAKITTLDNSVAYAINRIGPILGYEEALRFSEDANLLEALCSLKTRGEKIQFDIFQSAIKQNLNAIQIELLHLGVSLSNVKKLLWVQNEHLYLFKNPGEEGLDAFVAKIANIESNNNPYTLGIQVELLHLGMPLNIVKKMTWVQKEHLSLFKKEGFDTFFNFLRHKKIEADNRDLSATLAAVNDFGYTFKQLEDLPLMTYDHYLLIKDMGKNGIDQLPTIVRLSPDQIKAMSTHFMPALDFNEVSGPGFTLAQVQAPNFSFSLVAAVRRCGYVYEEVCNLSPAQLSLLNIHYARTGQRLAVSEVTTQQFTPMHYMAVSVMGYSFRDIQGRSGKELFDLFVTPCNKMNEERAANANALLLSPAARGTVNTGGAGAATNVNAATRATANASTGTSTVAAAAAAPVTPASPRANT